MNVTLEDLENICIEHNLDYAPVGTTEKRNNREKRERSYRGSSDGFINDYDLSVSWSAGGITGGSCWDEGESKHHSYSGDPEPEFSTLDLLLEQIKPDITFLQYKKIIATLVERETFTEYEYYGNSSNTAIKKINLKKLAEYLQENF